MNVKVENLEHSTAKIIVEVPAEDFKEATVYAYNKNKNKFNIPGFRRGRVKQEIIEKMYGPQVFYEDAIEYLVDETYPEAIEESGLEITSHPEITVEDINPGEPFVYTALVAVRPPVELGQYKGVTVERVNAEVTDADVEAELRKVQNQSARLITIEDEEREIKKDDIAIIKFVGYADGKAFEGGSGDNYPLTIGSHTFIDGFEDQLIGHKAGDELDVNVTFPVPYQVKELEGKDAVFKVTIKELRERQVPDIDDEFAAEVSEFDTLDEYKNQLRIDIKDRKDRAAAQENENRVIKTVVDNANIEIPELMLRTYVDNIISDFRRRISQQGITFNQYLVYLGQTADEFRKTQETIGARNIKTRLVLEEIVKQENLKASEDAYNEKMAELAKSYGVEPDQVVDLLDDEEIENIWDDLNVKEAVDFIVAEAELK